MKGRESFSLRSSNLRPPSNRWVMWRLALSAPLYFGGPSWLALVLIVALKLLALLLALLISSPSFSVIAPILPMSSLPLRSGWIVWFALTQLTGLTVAVGNTSAPIFRVNVPHSMLVNSTQKPGSTSLSGAHWRARPAQVESLSFFFSGGVHWTAQHSYVLERGDNPSRFPLPRAASSGQLEPHHDNQR